MRAAIVVAVVVVLAVCAAAPAVADFEDSSPLRAAPPPPAPGAYDCKFEDPETKLKYDLSPLMKSTGDYQFQSTDAKGSVTDYWINACRATVSELCGPDCSCCQQWDKSRADGKASLGKASTAILQAGKLPEQVANGGFTVQFTGGTPSATTKVNRQMEIDFICDAEADPPEGIPVYGGENPALHYNIKWATKLACPVKTGLSGGSIILIILLVVVVVYIAAGCIVNKFVRHKDGAEIFPNVEFWTSLPGLIKDGALFIGSKTCCRNASYGQV